MLTIKNVVRFAVAGAFVAVWSLSSAEQVSARPKFPTMMQGVYPKLEEAHGKDGKVTCTTCHPTTEKKKSARNNFGVAVGKFLEKKNETDADKLKEALKKAEKEASATEGKTFGDLLSAGEMPGTDKKAN
ncbi:MAG: hypothetical protein KDA91_10355 [Planctomycetaceae bacterium]|nr:hypothetical protein [Planctomycetaceae bacterium]